MAIEKGLYAAPQGIDELAEQQAPLEIEIEDPEAVHVGIDGEEILSIEQVNVFIFIHGTYGLRNIKKNLRSIKFFYYLYKDIIQNEFLNRMLNEMKNSRYVLN